ncbi:hypothetical protein [Kushneria aurantia]|uniref:Uncharacterized protein n=1 Tax=Kushneria aurantia TaxID=504092 RepID=A0ABV6G724_9GAMM|nr:hypothetical protein [Kushneria aurantia]
MAGGHGNGNNDPATALGFMGRLSAAVIAPVAVYLLLWQIGLGLAQPRFEGAALGMVVNLLSVVIPALGVLAAVAVAGRRSGSLIGAPVMVLFFLYLYISSAVTLEWLPPLLTLVGAGLGVALARWCPVMGEEVFARFRR